MKKDETLHGLLGMITAGQSLCFRISGGVYEAKDIKILKSTVAKWQQTETGRQK